MTTTTTTLRNRSALTLAALALAVVAVARPEVAAAKGGTHGVAVSTWDTSASTIVFGFQNGFITPGGGHLRDASYHVNFSSTSGKLSSQFGLHYLNYAPTDKDDSANGVGGSVLAMWAIPAGSRFANGLPKFSFNIFFGASPAVLISGNQNFVTIPLNLGVGLPFSPVKYVSIVPWIELAPSLNLDTKIKEFSGSLADYVDPANPDQIDLSQDDVSKILADSVEMETTFAFKVRGGLSLVFHLGDRVDLNLNGAVNRVGAMGKDNKTAIFVGGGLVIAWDHPVPAVLPVERRLENESCDAIGARYDQCFGSADGAAASTTETPVDAAPGTTTAIDGTIIVPPAPAPATGTPTEPTAAPAPAPAPATETTAPEAQ
jgi:hypothetical protein